LICVARRDPVANSKSAQIVRYLCLQAPDWAGWRNVFMALITDIGIVHFQKLYYSVGFD
jgi:hypothetical protein